MAESSDADFGSRNIVDPSRNSKVPVWLSKLKLDGDDTNIPFPDILRGSLYYPASGIDGRPVQYLSGFVYSFVYADYSYTAEELNNIVHEAGFTGYFPALRKKLSPNDLGLSDEIKPHGIPPLNDFVQCPFTSWYIFEREPTFGPEHGPERFSLLFLGAEGVAVYETLYLRNAIVPKVIAIISPGTGFGGNYTDFRDPNGLLASVMRRQRLPDYMVGDDKAFWPQDYPTEVLRFRHPNGNGMWRRKDN